MNECALTIACALLEFSGKDKEIQIFPHVRVDGDALGASSAMAIVLQKLNISSHIYIDEPIPDRLEFISSAKSFTIHFDESQLDSYYRSQGAALAIDCSDAGRMGRAGALFAKANRQYVIDHHVSSGQSFGFRYIEPKASAASEMVLSVIRILEEKTHKELLDADVANCLMVGIQSDTGRFTFQNTTSDTFRAAAELLDAGANVHDNGYNLFDLTNIARLKLTSQALSNAKLFYEGKLAMTVVTQEMIRCAQASEDAADGLAANLRDIKGVIVSFVLRETTDGEIRVNIRSYDPFDSAAFAAEFGGGGHHRAAGFTVENMTASELFRFIIEKVGEYLSRA